MLMIISNSKDATANYLQKILIDSAVEVLRFDTDRVIGCSSLAFDGVEVTLTIDGSLYRPSSFANVWYRRPERLRMVGDGTPEGKFVVGEWSEAFEGFFSLIPSNRWMNFPAAEANASHKIEQLHRARELGFRTPDTLVTQSQEALHRFFQRHQGRIITKPMDKGHIEKGPNCEEAVVFTNRVMERHLENCESLASCPTLFQAEVAKRADVRITVVDSDIHAVELVAKDADGEQRCDIRRNHMEDVQYSTIRLPQDVENLVRKLMASYGLRFGAIDMAVSKDNEWFFFEINPNGQWAWLDIDGGTKIADSFVKAFR